MQAWLARVNAGLPEAEWPVTCLLFAPNAPAQHPAEELWLKGKPHLRRNFAVNKTFAAVRRCFSAFLRTLRFESVKLRWYWPGPQRVFKSMIFQGLQKN